MKDLFKGLITDFLERPLPKIVSRNYKIPTDTEKIISLIGVRRSGKTFIFYDIIQNLRKSADPANMVYINFEDDRLFNIEIQDLDNLIQAYYELYPAKRNERVYLFLNEVQNVPLREQFARRIYDTLNLQLFITGSSSKLLSSEIATSLGGRTLTYEIFPFSFAEYLRLKEIQVKIHSASSRSFIQNTLEEYLFHGGFAETIEANEDIRTRILRAYLDLILYRDVIERHGIQNNDLLKRLLRYCMVNIGTLLSFNKLYNELKSQGYMAAKDTIFQYFSHLEDAFGVFTVPIFRNSVREETRNSKKIYGIDNGFKMLFDSSLSPDYSKLYENLVVLHLRRKSREIYYFKQKQKVDFYTAFDNSKKIINVAYNMDDKKTREREIAGLVEAMDYFNLEEALLITRDNEETVEVDGRKVHIVPLWKWLLSS